MTQQDFVCPSQMHNNPKQKNGQNSIFVCQSQIIPPPLVYAFKIFTFFFSIFVLQVSYCLNISRGQMFWWWGRRDIWKRVGIFNLFFFGRKKILVLFVVELPPQKGAKMGSFLKIASSKAMARRSTNYGAPFFFNGCVGSF